MSTGYQVYDQTKTYYVTFQIVAWIDIFTRKEYRDIIIEYFGLLQERKRIGNLGLCDNDKSLFI